MKSISVVSFGQRFHMVGEAGKSVVEMVSPMKELRDISANDIIERKCGNPLLKQLQERRELRQRRMEALPPTSVVIPFLEEMWGVQIVQEMIGPMKELRDMGCFDIIPLEAHMSDYLRAMVSNFVKPPDLSFSEAFRDFISAIVDDATAPVL